MNTSTYPAGSAEIKLHIKFNVKKHWKLLKRKSLGLTPPPPLPGLYYMHPTCVRIWRNFYLLANLHAAILIANYRSLRKEINREKYLKLQL